MGRSNGLDTCMGSSNGLVYTCMRRSNGLLYTCMRRYNMLLDTRVLNYHLLQRCSDHVQCIFYFYLRSQFYSVYITGVIYKQTPWMLIYHLYKGFNQLTLSMRKIFLHQVCLQSIPCGLIKMY